MTHKAGKILVIGAAGQVGGALLERLGPERAVGTFFQIALEGGLQFDIEEAARQPQVAAALLEQTKPAGVFIAAGMTRVDACEDDPDAANRANRDGPAAIAKAARTHGARTVFFSTEYVFDGVKGPYAEDSPPKPLSRYGQSKWEGEQALREADANALIVRTTVVYGPENQGKNFAYQLAARLAAGQPMSVPRDQVSSPTYNRDLAAATVSLFDAGAKGVFHIAGPEVLDRVTFARRLAQILGFDERLIEPTPTAQLKQKAPRPLHAGLQIDKLLAALPQFQPRTVEAAVEDWRQNPRGKAWPF